LTLSLDATKRKGYRPAGLDDDSLLY